MRYWNYFRVQLKRTVRLAVGVLPTAMLLFGCLALAAYFLFTKSFLADHQSKYQIGVVGGTDETYLGFGIQAIQTLDSTRFVVDFQPMEEKAARDAFLAGELTAYITVPDDFLDSVVYGRNDSPITYVAMEGQKGLTGFLMEELARIASRLVVSSQGSIYAMQRAFIFFGRTGRLSELTDQINLKLIEYVLGRSKLAELTVLGYSMGLTVGQYYFGAVLLLFCFLFGLSSAPLFLGRNESLGKWMKLRGIGPVFQVILEWVPYTLLMLFSLTVPLIISGKLTDQFHFMDWDLDTVTLLVTFLPLSVMISAMHFMFYELIQNTVANILLQFVAAVSMGYVSGFFFPADFFPEGLSAMGRALPTGVAMDYYSATVLGSTPGRLDGRVLLYLVCFLTVTVCVRARKIVRED